MRILFSGYYGQKNTGDDAFVEVASWGAQKKWQTGNYRFLCKNENVPNTKFVSKGFPFSIPKTYKLQKGGLLLNSDYLISAGGSRFYSLIEHSGEHYAKKIKSIKNHLKLGAIGISLGPFRNSEGEKRVVEYLKKLEFLTLRDQYSYNYAKSLDLAYEPIEAFDLAALLQIIYGGNTQINKNKESNKPIIGISVCNYESYTKGGDLKNEERRIVYIENVLKRLEYEGNYKFHFFIFNNNPNVGDERVTHRAINTVQPKSYKVIPYSPKTENTWNQIAACDVMISTRMHAGIFACFADTPFFQIEYHRKCSDFLDDVGQSDDYRLYDAEKDIDQAVYSIRSVLEDKEYTPPRNKKDMIDKAMLNFSKINLEKWQ